MDSQGDFCEIIGTFSADAAGYVRIEGDFTYNDGHAIASAATETTVQAPTGQVVAVAQPQLQNPTYVNQGPYSFTFTFTNNGPDPVTGNGVFNAHGAPASVVNNCLNKTLAHGEPCTMVGTFSPTTTGDVTLNGDFIYDAGAHTASTSTETSVNASSGIIAQVITALPPNAESNTNYPVAFRFTNTSGATVHVTQQLTLPNVTGITNTCPNPGSFSGTSPSNVCTISGTFNSASSASVQTLTAEMNSSLPQAVASTETLTNPTSSFFVSFWPVSLRVSAGALNMPYQFQYTLVNNNAASSTPVTINFIAPTGVTLTEQAPTSPPTAADDPYFKSYYQCLPGGSITAFDPNSNLALSIPSQASNGVCNIFVSFLASATTPPNPYTENFTMAFAGSTAGFPSVITPLSYATGQPVEANGVPLTRTIHFTNHCPYPVSYALHGASVQAKNQSSVACTTDADCFSGSACIGSECQWIQPVPTNGYELAAAGGSTSVVIPIYDNAMKLNLDAARDVAWGGNLAGRVGCTAGVGCTVNDCGLAAGGAIGACSTGIGSARAPISASEFTLQSDDPLIYSNNVGPNEAVDNYNVQTIDGVTVPSTMTPSNAPYNASVPYSCGGAGLKTVQSGSSLASCPWTYTAPLSDYNWVQYTASQTPCTTTEGQCTGLPGTICGLMVNPTGDAVFTKACGLPAFASQLMYWTADAICKIVPTYNVSPFFCSNGVSTIANGQNVNSPGSTPISTLYACNAGELAVSCYTAGVSDTCCGCSNWASSPTGTQACTAINPGWTEQVLPLISWTKTGCPTSYAFPFDDASSSFTCLVNEVLTIPQDTYDGNINTTNYNVEFCPQ